MPKPPIEPRVLHSLEPLRCIELQESIGHVILLHFHTVCGDKYFKIVSLDEMSIKRNRRAPAWNWWVIAEVKNANPFIRRHAQSRDVGGLTLDSFGPLKLLPCAPTITKLLRVIVPIEV